MVELFRECFGLNNELISQHSLYRQLGTDAVSRQSSNRKLFRAAVGDADLQAIRDSTNKGWVLGIVGLEKRLRNYRIDEQPRNRGGGQRRRKKTKEFESDPITPPFSRRSQADHEPPTATERHASMTWAQRLKRVFNIDIETCNACGGAMKVIACIEDPVVIQQILDHLKHRALPKSRAPPVELQQGLFD